MSRAHLFGALLRMYRESYWARVTGRAAASDPAPQMKLSALALIRCLKESGYPISSPAYSEIEAGKNMPRDAQGFIDKTSQCLKLTDDQKRRLYEAMAYDLVYPRLGGLSTSVLRQFSAFGKQLKRWRGRNGMSVEQLAGCLTGNGFLPVVASRDGLDMMSKDDLDDGELTPGDLAKYISLIEDFFVWPFAEEQRAVFVDFCVRCLGAESKDDLRRGMEEDVQLARLIAGEDDCQDDDDAEHSAPADRPALPR